MMSSDAPSEQQVAAKGRALEAARWELPKPFRLRRELLALPPEQLKEKDPEMYALWERIKADEKRLAASMAMPFEQMPAQDIYRARAVQRSEEHKATIARLDKEIGQAIVVGGESLEALQATKRALRHRLAEQYALMGRYDLAAEAEPDPILCGHYLDILEAVWRDDDGDGSHCGCPPIRGSGEYADLTVPSWNQKEEIFSIKHGRVVTLMQCSNSKCGFMNAIDPPAHILQQRRHRDRAMQMAGKMSPEDAAKTLRAAGHTTTKLLK
jgi:hypothetical protein